MKLPKRRFQQELKQRFSKDEIRAVCFSLGINHEELDEKNITTLTESLLLYIEKRGRITDLVEILRSERPQIDWLELAFADVDCPYRGLLPFREEDAHLFYGRDAYTDRLLEAVDKRPFVAVIGPSGSGKSSVVFAGLVPRLRQTDQWQIIDFSPGKTPFDTLSGELIPLLEPDKSENAQLVEANAQSENLIAGKISLHQIMARIVRKLDDGKRILLIVDQFEELYTQTEDTTLQEDFTKALLSLRQVEAVAVLLTMRADFLDRALAYRPFADELQAATQMIGPMDREELTEVIERPLSGTFVTFEPGLTTQILDDVGKEPGNLPLLEFALESLWQEQVDGKLTFAVYEKIDKVEGALTKQADAVFGEYEEKGKDDLVRELFVQLVQPVNTSVNTKRKAWRRQLSDDLWQLAADLADDRLIVTNQDDKSGEDYIELAHEALITNWKRFDGWIQQDWEFRAWQERLRAAIIAWEASDKDKEALLRGAQLGEAQGWYERTASRLPDNEREFIKLSLEAEQKREGRRRMYTAVAGIAAILFLILAVAFGLSRQDLSDSLAESEQLREDVSTALDESEQLRGDLNVALSTSDASLVEIQTKEAQALADSTRIAVAAIQAQEKEAEAVAERDEAERQRRIAVGQTLAALSALELERSGNAELSALLAIEAMRASGAEAGQVAWLVDDNLRPVLQNDLFKNQVIDVHESIVLSMAYSPDGRWLASGSIDGTVRLWPLGGDGQPQPSVGPVVLPGHDSNVTSVAYSSDGRWLASGSIDGTVRLWSLGGDGRPQPGGRLVVLRSNESVVRSVAYSLDGRWLASGSDDGTVRLWSLGGDGQPQPGVEPVVLSGHEDWINSVEYSPDGRWLASGSSDRTVRLWSLGGDGQPQPGVEPVVLSGHESGVRSVAYSPDGRWLASGSADRTVRLWPLGGDEQPQPGVEPVVLSGHEGWVNSVEYSPDGRWLASGSDDRSVRLWPLGGDEQPQPGVEPVVLSGHESTVMSVAYSPDGGWLASGSADRTVRLWSLGGDGQPQLGVEPVVLSGHESWVNSVEYSPDGRWLASGSDDRSVRLWPLGEDGQPQLGVEPVIVLGNQSNVLSVAYSPDGRWLASGGTDGTVRLWSLGGDGQPQLSRELVVLSGHVDDWVTSVAYSPNGGWLASGSSDGTVRLWSLGGDGQPQPGVEPVVLSGYDSGDLSVAYGPNGGWLASGSSDGTVRLWPLGGDGQPQPGVEPVVLSGQSNVISVAYSPDGGWLASGSSDGTVRLWPLGGGGQPQPGVEPVVLSGHESNVMSVAYSPNGRWLAGGSADGTVRLWLSPEALIENACQVVQRNLSWEEWQLYMGDEPYEQTCPNLPPPTPPNTPTTSPTPPNTPTSPTPGYTPTTSPTSISTLTATPTLLPSPTPTLTPTP